MPPRKTITLVLPYPPQELLPNATTWSSSINLKTGKPRRRSYHHQEKATATREARSFACLSAIKQLKAMKVSGLKGSPKVSFCWFSANNKRPDYVSIYRATKPIEDGALVDSGLLPDDSPKVIKGIELSYGPPDKRNPRTEITIELQSPKVLRP